MPAGAGPGAAGGDQGLNEQRGGSVGGEQGQSEKGATSAPPALSLLERIRRDGKKKRRQDAAAAAAAAASAGAADKM